MPQDLLHFFFGQDGGQAFGLFGAQGVNGAQILVEYLVVEKEQRAEGLVLGGGGDIFFHGQVSEKGFHFGGAHLGRVAYIVEVDVAFDPIDVGFFGADGVVFEADGVADTFDKLSAGLVEEFLRFGSIGVPPDSVDNLRFLPYNSC